MGWRTLAQSIVRRAGYVITKLPLEGSLERDLQRLLEDRTITTVLDIGAHEGRYGQTMRRIGFNGRIISFEPSPTPFQRLQSKLDTNWEALPMALGAEETTADLHEYCQHEEFTSLRRPSEFGRERWGLEVARTLSVPVRRLDDLATELAVEAKSALIKIDTQGHDAAVIAGGIDTIRRAAALQVEIPMFGLYEDAPSATDVIERLRDLGFDLVGMYPVHEPPRDLIPVEFDGLFARTHLR